jgi:hypothetical protein
MKVTLADLMYLLTGLITFMAIIWPDSLSNTSNTLPKVPSPKWSMIFNLCMFYIGNELPRIVLLDPLC